MAVKLIIKHSNETNQGGNGKLPLASELDFGEIAINYHAGVERIYLKNDSGDVVGFVNENDISNLVSGSGVNSIVKLYQSEYDALPTKLDNVFYIVEPDVIISAGTIVYWNGSALKYCKSENWSSSLGTPVAVAVVPNTHTPDGTVRCMAVTGVKTNGDSGSTNSAANWGPWTEDTALANLTNVSTFNNTVGGIISASTSTSYLSSNKGFTGSTDCLDVNLKYDNTTGPFIPNPYLPDGSPNPDFRNTESVSNNICSDFDGIGNTNVLDGLGSDYEMARRCRLYSTPGIGVGEWYLPAFGELAYIMPRFNEIQSSLRMVNGVQLIDTDYWSSSEHSQYYSRCICVTDGRAYIKMKNNALSARPFCSLPTNLGF